MKLKVLVQRLMRLAQTLKDILSFSHFVFIEAMNKHPDQLRYLINLLLISRHLERIADHAANIAE
jgi:phosphate uptake regulator